MQEGEELLTNPPTKVRQPPLPESWQPGNEGETPVVTLVLHRDVPAPWQGEVNHGSAQSVGGLPMVMVQCLHRLFAEPAPPAPPPHPFRLPRYPFRSEMPAPCGAQGRKGWGVRMTSWL